MRGSSVPDSIRTIHDSLQGCKSLFLDQNPSNSTDKNVRVPTPPQEPKLAGRVRPRGQIGLLANPTKDRDVAAANSNCKSLHLSTESAGSLPNSSILTALGSALLSAEDSPSIQNNTCRASERTATTSHRNPKQLGATTLSKDSKQLDATMLSKDSKQLDVTTVSNDKKQTNATISSKDKKQTNTATLSNDEKQDGISLGMETPQKCNRTVSPARNKASKRELNDTHEQTEITAAIETASIQQSILEQEQQGIIHGVQLELPNYGWIDRQRRVYQGPTTESNWVLPGKLMVGAYPSSNNDTLNREILHSMLSLGITTFVCLQDEYLHSGVTEKMWRHEGYLRPYIFDALKLSQDYWARERSRNSGSYLVHNTRGFRKATHNHTRTNARIHGGGERKPSSNDTPLGTPIATAPSYVKPNDLRFLHVPIVDCACTTDQIVLDLATELCWRIIRGEVLYVHCWGGHGRTGTVVGVMLALLYGLDSEEALNRVQYYHDLRAAKLTVRSPQTEHQRDQVRRIVNRCHSMMPNGSVKMLSSSVLRIPKDAIHTSRFQLEIIHSRPSEQGIQHCILNQSTRSSMNKEDPPILAASTSGQLHASSVTNNKPVNGIRRHSSPVGGSKKVDYTSQASEAQTISHVPHAPGSSTRPKLWDRSAHGYRYHRISQNRTHGKHQNRKNLASQDLNCSSTTIPYSGASDNLRKSALSSNANDKLALSNTSKLVNVAETPSSVSIKENATIPVEAVRQKGPNSVTSRIFHKARKLVVNPFVGADLEHDMIGDNTGKEVTVRVNTTRLPSPKEYRHKINPNSRNTPVDSSHLDLRNEARNGEEQSQDITSSNYVRPIKPPKPRPSDRSTHMNVR